METGAIQCGYCTPGMLLAAKSLLDKEHFPDILQTRKALSAVLCRCTGYVKPVEAVLRAAAYLRAEPTPPLNDDFLSDDVYTLTFDGHFPPPPVYGKSGSPAGTGSALRLDIRPEILPAPTKPIIGAPKQKVDALRLAKGHPAFTDDFTMPGMLHAALLTSPHAHARILHINVSKALALPGVWAVLTYKDLPRVLFAPGCQSYPNPMPYDQVSLDNKVRHVGDKVAVVAAETPEIARQALSLIEVEY